MSYETTIARSHARYAEQDWQAHRKTCLTCTTAAAGRSYYLLCLLGAILKGERDTLRADL